MSHHLLLQALYGRAVRIPLSDEHHLGTEDHPYRLDASESSRRRAIEAGIRERTAKMPPRAARVNVKRRLNVHRIHRKHKESCHVVEGDMRWLDEHHLEGGVTTAVCTRASKAIRAGQTFRVRMRFVPAADADVLSTPTATRDFAPFFHSQFFLRGCERALRRGWCDVDGRGHPELALTGVDRISTSAVRNEYLVWLRGRYASRSELDELTFWSEAFKCLQHQYRAAGVTRAYFVGDDLRVSEKLPSAIRSVLKANHNEVELVGLKVAREQQGEGGGSD